MIHKIEIYLFVLSVFYILIFLIRLLIVSREVDPKPLNITTTEKIFLYLAPSYIITAIITLLF